MSNEKKPLIIISSRTGNTMMLGHALCDALPGSTLVRPADLPEDLSGYDPVLLGFWCDRGHAPEEMERAAERLRGKRIGCFATMGGNPQDEKARVWMQRTAEELVRKGEGNTLEGTFLCRGREREARRAAAETHPDRLDLARCVEAFRSVFGANF